MTKQEAYRMVVNDIRENCGSTVFMGCYDAKNGNPSFMHGVLALMEYMAYQADDDAYDLITTEFINNMVKSGKKVKYNKKER